MKIGKELAIEASKKGLCEDWFNKMIKLDDKKALVEMYIQGIDFCLSNNFPTNEYIQKHFKGIMEPFGVYLEDSFNLINRKNIIALGNSIGSVEIDSYNVSEIYIKNSKIKLTAKDNSFIMIDLFEDSIIEIEASGNAKICVNRYQGITTIKKRCSDNAIIKIIDKLKKTY